LRFNTSPVSVLLLFVSTMEPEQQQQRRRRVMICKFLARGEPCQYTPPCPFSHDLSHYKTRL
jgi:hypothetical protein